jgi:hypothetical protein
VACHAVSVESRARRQIFLQLLELQLVLALLSVQLVDLGLKAPFMLAKPFVVLPFLL